MAAQLVRLVVGAGKATASPPIGPALGARGVKAMDFCKEFNARTAHITPGTPTPVNITIQADRTFTFITKSPQTSYLIKQAISLDKGSGEAGKVVAGTISLKAVYEIAKIKSSDQGMGSVPLEGIVKSVIGSCRSLGVKVIA